MDKPLAGLAGRYTDPSSSLRERLSIYKIDSLAHAFVTENMTFSHVSSSLRADRSLPKTLTHENIQDHDKYKKVGVQLSLSVTNADKYETDGKDNVLTDKQGQPIKARDKDGKVIRKNSYGANVPGASYVNRDKRQDTNATVSGTEIEITDKTAQKKLEDEGKTQKLASLNTDINKAQIITKDKNVNLDIYVSDTAVREVIKGIEIVGKTVGDAFSEVADKLVTSGKLTPQQAAQAKQEANDALSISEGIDSGRWTQAQLDACATGGSAWNLLNLFVTPAHAACAIILSNGEPIPVEFAKKCKKIHVFRKKSTAPKGLKFAKRNLIGFIVGSVIEDVFFTETSSEVVDSSTILNKDKKGEEEGKIKGGHTTKKRPSVVGKHEKGEARRKQDQKGHKAKKKDTWKKRK